MIGLAAKFLLLGWTITAKGMNEFVEPEDARSVPPKNETLKFSLPETFPTTAENKFQKFLRQPEENRINSGTAERAFQTNITNPVFFSSKNHVSAQSLPQNLKADTALLFEKMESCRKNHSDTSNIQLYGSLLGDFMKDENKAFEAALRDCNISEELVDKLKTKLAQLEVFQGVFVLIPKNISSESPDPVKSTQQPTPPESRIYSHGGKRATEFENNLKLKLGDEWIPIKSKVSHLSHIYVGSSIYPILTEESRVLEYGHTIAGPTPTKESLAEGNEKPSHWLKDLFFAPSTPPQQKIYQVEASPQRRCCKSQNPSRLSRSLQRKGLTYTGSQLGKETTESQNYVDPSTNAPEKLDLLPKSSYRWSSVKSNQDNMETKCAVDLKRFNEDPHYKVIYKLCSEVLENFKEFLQTEVLKQKIPNEN